MNTPNLIDSPKFLKKKVIKKLPYRPKQANTVGKNQLEFLTLCKKTYFFENCAIWSEKFCLRFCIFLQQGRLDV